jgi:serine protease AprX
MMSHGPARLLFSASLLLLSSPFGSAAWDPGPGERISVIVQGPDLAAAKAQVEALGGRLTHELGVIGGVAASVTPAQHEALAADPGLRVALDRPLHLATGGLPGIGSPIGQDTHFPTLVGADGLHAEGTDGYGVTIALLDTGVFPHWGLARRPDGSPRILAGYDAVTDHPLPPAQTSDLSGHGSHVASVMVSSVRSPGMKHNGIAPAADLVLVKAFDRDGRGTYADAIRGIDWVLQHQAAYGIRVLNLSFSAELRSHYWEDPLNQAVMAAWKSGIVVVASAGNFGPEPMSVGVPGNVPYVITVGAMTDSYTPEDPSDDLLASFSAAGPTFEGFVKPEVVAPGGHIMGLMHQNATLRREYPQYVAGDYYFVMSGTSQAAGVVSGVAALILQRAPWLTPDEVKCVLLKAARPAVDADGALAYSIFQQGAGLVHAGDAVSALQAEPGSLECANQGLDIAKDLAGLEHYRGRARQADDGTFHIEGLEGYGWSGGFAASDGYLWIDGYLWADGYLWVDGEPWSEPLAWVDGYLWVDGYAWSQDLTELAAINIWADQE